MKTPLESLRAYCVHCNGGVFQEVPKCTVKLCSFWKNRMGKGRISVKQFRKFCMDCMGGAGKTSAELVRTCIVEDCFCYPYRFGTNPNFVVSDERHERLSEQLRNISRKRTRTIVEEPVKRTRTRGGV